MAVCLVDSMASGREREPKREHRTEVLLISGGLFSLPFSPTRPIADTPTRLFPASTGNWQLTLTTSS